MGKVFCAVCRKRCKGDILKVEQQFVHHKCFQCTKCHKNLQKGGFFIRDKRFYCPEDYQTEFGVKCEACQTFVEGEVVTVLGKTFHSQCFRCRNCQRPFVSGERTTIFEGSYYCTSCAGRFCNGVSSGGLDDPDAISKASPAKTLESVSRVALSSTLSNGFQNGLSYSASPPLSSSGLVDEVAFKDGQLTVQINENGYANTDLVQHKGGVITNHFGEHGDPHCADTILSTTPGQTFSGESFCYSVGDRRIFPPGVDYGRHYPVSYLKLAERGHTAIMSSEEVPLQPDSGGDATRARSLLRSPLLAYQRQSRKDTAKPVCPASAELTTSSRNQANATGLPTAVHQNGLSYADQGRSQGATYNSQSSYSFSAAHTPVSFSGRPRRDLYVRRRELSPGSASLGSGIRLNYHSRIGRSETVGSPFVTPDRGSSYSRSIPNGRGKRGMTMLAESLVKPRVRPDRSLSPELLAESSAEARRLASYPNARIPDSASLPAIDRFDFPAPPSPAVVMLEKRREKRLAEQRSATSTLDNGTLRATGITSTDSTEGELDQIPAHVSSKLRQIDAEIETLKRLGESSGITAALIQELEASKLVHIRGPDLDPVSASRSPNANTEPGYKTRYDRHVFASPSRDTRRDRRTAHTLSYRMDYSSTGGRSGTIPSFPSKQSNDSPAKSSRLGAPSTSALRPGYTSGVLYGRAISLPRPAMGQSLDSHRTDVAHTPLVRAYPSAIRGTVTLDSGGQPVCDGSGDHTLMTDESLHTTPGAFDLHGPVGSLATSALSMDGLTAGSGDDVITLAPTTTSSYLLKSATLSGVPPSVTGLRPVSALLKQQALTGRLRSRTHTPMRHLSDYDSDTEFDAYPSVQSWLRSSTSRRQTSFKTYPYEQLKISSGLIPKGIDRARLENYLSPSDFETVFGMPISTFKRLPEWKQNDLKKKVDLV